MRKVKLKVLLPFHDMQNNGLKRLKNEEFICSISRAKEIIDFNKNLVKILSITKNQ